MDAKDQRLEIRIPQQQLDELDAIRESVDSAFIPSRSDIVRMFIAQGIERINKSFTSAPQNINLGEKLSLFFQMEQIRILERAFEPKPGHTNYNHYSSAQLSKPSNAELIKKVYLNGYSWFFELDAGGLSKLDSSLQGDAIAVLMNEAPSLDVIKDVAFVTNVLKMFSDVEACMQEQSENYQLVEFIKTLSEHKRIPLSFVGFPPESKILNEIAALKKYASGEISYLRMVEDEDGRSEKYAHMFYAYSESKKNNNYLTLEALQKIIMNNF